MRRFYAVIKSNPKQGLASAIKNAEARLEGVKDALNDPMIQVYERVVYELKHTTPYRYNEIRRRICGK